MTETPIPGKTFDQWLDDIMPEVTQAQTILEESLSSEPSTLAAQANIYEDSYARLTDILSQANAWLDHAEYIGFLSIDKELTVQRQASEIKFIVIKKRMFRDKIKGLCQAIGSRMKRAQWRS